MNELIIKSFKYSLAYLSLRFGLQFQPTIGDNYTIDEKAAQVSRI